MQSTEQKTPPELRFSIKTSPGFAGWLEQQDISIAFTTYRAGKLFAVGRESGRPSIYQRNFPKCMGLSVDSNDNLWMCTLDGVMKLSLSEHPSYSNIGMDRVLVPRTFHWTGDALLHDLALTPDDNPLFVTTRFNCVSRLDDKHGFEPVWKPPFIDGVHAEDRCHINGLALDGDQPGYATLAARSNTRDGWRDHMQDGGLVLDIQTGESVTEGLSMPHSPRLHRGQLWILDSGTGNLGVIDRRKKQFRPVCFLPGFLRGLCFHDKYAIVASSQARDLQQFQTFELSRTLGPQPPMCGLFVVDIERAEVVHVLDIQGDIRELFDVTVLPGLRRPAIHRYDEETEESLLFLPEQNEGMN